MAENPPGAVNIGAVNPAIGAGTNPWEAISQAITGGLNQRKDDFQAKQDREAVLQQRQVAQDQLKRSNAQQSLQTMKPFIMNNPQYADNPQVLAVMKQHFDQLGLPMPTTPDGKFDIGAFKDPVPDDVINRIQSLPVGSARTALYNQMSKQYSGLDPELLTASTALTPKDTAAISKIQMYGQHLENADQALATRTRNQSVLAEARTGLMTDEAKNLITKNGLIQAQIKVDLANASAIPQRVQIMQQNANTMLQRVNDAATKGSLSHTQLAAANRQMDDIQREYHRDADLVNKLQTQQAAAALGGKDDSDPEYAANEQQIQLLQKSITDMQPTIDKINDTRTSNFDNVIAASTLSRATGNQTSVVSSRSGSGRNTGTNPANYDVGGIYTDPQGKKWKKQASGTWVAN